jgi:hypothetical protein
LLASAEPLHPPRGALNLKSIVKRDAEIVEDGVHREAQEW